MNKKSVILFTNLIDKAYKTVILFPTKDSVQSYREKVQCTFNDVDIMVAFNLLYYAVDRGDYRIAETRPCV